MSALRAVAAALGGPPAPAVTDWDEVIAAVRAHRVGPPVHRAGTLAAMGAPAAVLDAVARDARAAQHATMAWAALQLRLVRALDARGIRALAFKGPVTALDAHGDPSARHVGDLDLLVARSQAVAAARVLHEQGLRSRDGVAPEDLLRSPLRKEAKFALDGFDVDLHWHLHQNPHLQPLDPDRVAARTLTVAGAPVLTLPLDTSWRLLLLHGARHRWHRLKWLADVPATARRHPQVVARDALAASARDGHAAAVASSLLVAEAALGPFLPEDARDWARSIRGARLLAREAHAALAAGEWTGLRPRELPRYATARLALRRDGAYRRTEAAHILREAAGGAHPVAAVPRYLARTIQRAR